MWDQRLQRKISCSPTSRRPRATFRNHDYGVNLVRLKVKRIIQSPRPNPFGKPILMRFPTCKSAFPP